MSSISSEEIISILKSEIENFDSEATDKETLSMTVTTSKLVKSIIIKKLRKCLIILGLI